MRRLIAVIALSGCVTAPVRAIKPEPVPTPLKAPEKPQTVSQGVIHSAQTIYFDYDRANIRQSEVQKVREVAKLLHADARLSVRIEGHADERGTPDYNIVLGSHRARSAGELLVILGIARNRMTLHSYGEEFPVGTHAQNRRVVWVIE